MHVPADNSLHRKQRGFSLLELLLVIAIMGLLAVMASGTLGMVDANRITTAALKLRSTAELARQTAITSGSPVDLRFYQPTTSPTGSSNDYTAFRLVTISGSIQTPMRIIRLPDGIGMRSNATSSTLLSSSNPCTITETTPPGGFLSTARYVRFLPNGGLDILAHLPSIPWCVSIAKSAAPAVANDLPTNFATVCFDALLGSTGIYRP